MNNTYSLKTLFNVEKHRVIVTGANGQVGSEIVDALIDLGSKVIAVDIEFKNLEKHKSNENFIKFKCDITSEKNVKKLYAQLNNKNIQPTALINNAGISFFNHFLERSEVELDETYEVNLKASVLLIRYFYKMSSKKKFTRKIINIASHYGIIAPNFSIYSEGDRRNSEIYGATKAGLIQITKYFSTYSYKYNILVNAIAPGGIFNPKSPQSSKFKKKYSEICPLKRMAETKEVIGAIIYLLSDSSSYTNGHTIAIDGGFSVW